MASIKGHRITWWVYAGTERIRSQKSMRGAWGYDATCECGWDSKTGGATATSVGRMVNDHKWDASGTPLLAAMNGDRENLIWTTCRALTASCSGSRNCDRCNPHHDDHFTKENCAAALSSLQPCSRCDSPGAWTAADIYRRNS